MCSKWIHHNFPAKFYVVWIESFGEEVMHTLPTHDWQFSFLLGRVFPVFYA